MTHTRLAGGGSFLCYKAQLFHKMLISLYSCRYTPPPSCYVFLPRMVVASPYVSLIWILLAVNSLFEYIYMHTCPKQM